MGLGVALAPQHVALCQARRRRGRVEVARAVTVPLPANALAPAFGAPNLQDLEACEAALAEALDRARVRGALVAVALPDPAVRVRMLPREPASGTREEKARLVAWQLRETLPFPPEEARVDYRPAGPGRAGAGGPRVCLLAAAAVVRQYEALFERRRLLPIQIGAASLALWSLLERPAGAPRRHDEPLAVLFVEETYATLLALAAGSLRSWRCLLERGAGAEALAREVGDSLYGLTQDGTLPGPPRVLVHAAASRGDEVLAALRREVDLQVGEVAWPDGLPANPALLPAVGAALSV